MGGNPLLPDFRKRAEISYRDRIGENHEILIFFRFAAGKNRIENKKTSPLFFRARFRLLFFAENGRAFCENRFGKMYFFSDNFTFFKKTLAKIMKICYI